MIFDMPPSQRGLLDYVKDQIERQRARVHCSQCYYWSVCYGKKLRCRKIDNGMMEKGVQTSK
jgi:hypothetical protein